MRTLGLTLVLLVAPLVAEARQTDPPDGATIASAQVSGFDLGQLSPGLQEEIGRLAGGPLDRARLGELAARIEEEQPRFVAAVRVVRSPDDEVRVVFVVAHMRDQDRRGNANARYLIESVEIKGIPETDLSPELRAELKALIGMPYGSDVVGEFEGKLKGALPEHDVVRRIDRGFRSREVRLLFYVRQAESARWLHFTPLKSSLVYHSDQGWGAFLDFGAGDGDFRFTPIFAMDYGDDLIEDYWGYGLRVESRRLGTERLGASFEWFHATGIDWQGTTLAAIDANPAIPGAYDERSTIAPLVSVALTRQLSVRGGVSITEIEPLSGVPASQTANAFVVSAGYLDQWKRAGAAHDLDASFGVRAATESLESDFSYERYFGQAGYRYRRDHHTVLVSGMAGGISGPAPLFERFSLGDSRTLRGWNKYDIAPAGGDRMFHTSVEYQYQGLAFFLDTGSVWDNGNEARTRVAAGFGFHPGPFFMTVGFPLNTDNVRAVFTAGVRFGGLGARY